MAGRPQTFKLSRTSSEKRQSMFCLRHAEAAPNFDSVAYSVARAAKLVENVKETKKLNNMNKSKVLDQDPKNFTTKAELSTPAPTSQDDYSWTQSSASSSQILRCTSSQIVGDSGDKEEPVQEVDLPDLAFAYIVESNRWLKQLKRYMTEKNEKPFPSPYIYAPRTYIIEENHAKLKFSNIILENISDHDVTFMIKTIPNKSYDVYVGWIPKRERRAVNYCARENYDFILRQRLLVFVSPVVGQAHLDEVKLRHYWKALGSELLPYSVVECQIMRPVVQYKDASMLEIISCIPPFLNTKVPGLKILKPHKICVEGNIRLFIPKLVDPLKTLWARCFTFAFSTFVIRQIFTLADKPSGFGVQHLEKLHTFFLTNLLLLLNPPPPLPEPDWYEYFYFWNWEWQKSMDSFVSNFL